MKSFRLVRGIVALSALAALGAGFVARPAPAGAAPKGWSLPAGAREVAPDVWEIGTEVRNGRTLTGFAIIDRGHGEQAKGGKGGGGSTSVGYTYLASGLKWKQFGESWVVDPAISATHSDSTMTSDYITGVVAGAIAQWEDAAQGGLEDGGASVDIMGDGGVGTVDRANIGVATNGVNEVCFGAIAQSGVIAVTFVWGYYSGPPQSREIVEWDQMYDDSDFSWSDVGTTGDTSKMDFSNIATHEIGHAFGMGHPSNTYTLETMYAYASQGELIKRDLHDGDVAGIDGLY
jgi:matrixin